MTFSNPLAPSAMQRPRPALARRFTLGFLSLALLGLAGCTAPLQGWGGAVVAGQSVYFASPNGKVFKLNASAETRQSSPTGIVAGAGEWEFPPEKDKRVGYFYSPPAVSEQAVYVTSTSGSATGPGEGKLYALNAQNGTVVWEYPQPNNPEGRKLGLLVGSPAFGNGMVFTSDGHNSLRALDATTGAEKWSFATDNKIWSTPVVQGGVVYFGSLDQHVVAVDAATGAKKWEFQAGGTVPGTPLVTRDTVYIGAGDRKLYALDAATGEKKWEFLARNWFWTQPVLHNGVIYASALDHRLYALDASTGREVWPAPFQAPKLVLAPPVISGDLLTVTTEDGAVISVDVATGQQRSSGRVEPSTALYGNVAGANGTAFIPGVDNVLHAVDMASGRTVWTFKAS